MAVKNRLLACLPPEVYGTIEPDLKPLPLARGQVLHRPGDEIRFLYFPTTCLVSITVTMRGGQMADTGVVGSRGVVGINAFMGGRETTQTAYVVQIAGEALKIAADPLKAEFDKSRGMRDAMLRYTQALLAQISQNVACNRLHGVGERYARWLLEVRERTEADDIPLTHDYLAGMLGVRRAGVTEAAGRLRAKGFIEYSRGHIRITDVGGLEAASCECYEVLKEEYDRLLGEGPRHGEAAC